MNPLSTIRSLLKKASLESPPQKKSFYKTKPGDYAEHDQFLGIKVQVLRKIVCQSSPLSFEEIKEMLYSPWNEERLLALFILVKRYQKGEKNLQEAIYHFYIDHRERVNNWNLVDSSAPFILGAHLLQASKEPLFQLVTSKNMWERRMSIVATLAFIRKNECQWTFKIAEKLLLDQHDLIHKATGWMLREAGKRNFQGLIHFLDRHASFMPRTMLRCALEKCEKNQRDFYLQQRK